jgi:hypothetical protein
MMTQAQAELLATYPKPEACGEPHPDDPSLTCNLSPHGPDARHYSHGRTWPVAK